MYQYYHSVQITEHCLRAEEIAGIFGIFTTSSKPHAMLMGALLKEKEVDVYYYESSKGLLKGYLFNDYYHIVMDFLQSYADEEQVKIGNKNFKMLVNPRYWDRQELIDKLNNIYRDSKVM